MPETDPSRGRWLRVTHSLSTKLNSLLLTAMLLIFASLGYLNIRLHRQHLEQSTLLSAERVSDVITRTTTDYMLRNDREGLHRIIQTISDEPGMAKVRIFDRDGRITYSTDSAELGRAVDKGAEACYGCHSRSQPLARLNRPDRFRIYRNGGGRRILGIITPIENRPACSNAACHAHPAQQQILGVLDTNLSLATADVQLAQSSRQMILYTGLALIVFAALSWLLIWRTLSVPLRALEKGTEHLARGELGYQIATESRDEIGDLARSFNTMSREIQAAHEENLAWTRTLETRVDQKTRELRRAHEHALQTEKMASIGKMAAVLAHEINNPLSGILTYAKLLRKWIDREDGSSARRKDIYDSLDLIASESRRCGDLVKNLLTFSRTAPMNIQPADLNQIVQRSLRLVQHQLDLAGVQVQVKLDPRLPQVECDAAQIEQVLLALMMNAIDALAQGGNLWLTTSVHPDESCVRIIVRDDGAGIPPEILPRIFEPFLTTKEAGHGVGLGLAISRAILERHNGNITVESEPARGTTFTVNLPWEAEPESATLAGASAAGRR
ncbi:MAG TPA: ATP-binding protein [Candidatus Sulfotelmatobacter sp.]|nr:ATP-binding protein [Candidatus Sulfotelmatobacter sp.]